MIHLQNLSIGHRGHPILSDISVTFREGELIALLGRNGSGKSTLIRTIAGLLKPVSGKIFVQDRDISTMSRQEIAKLISLSSTSGIRVPHMKCWEFAAMGRAPWTNWAGKLLPRDERIVDRAMDSVGMRKYENMYTDRISDGEYQKMVIARALSQDTPVLLLDEPTAFLDVPGRHQIIGILAKLAAEEHKTIIFSTHDTDIALKRASKVFLIDSEGVFFGDASDSAVSIEIRRIFDIE